MNRDSYIYHKNLLFLKSASITSITKEQENKSNNKNKNKTKQARKKQQQQKQTNNKICRDR